MNKRLLLYLYDRSGLGAYMPIDLKGQELQVEEHMEKFALLIVERMLDITDAHTTVFQTDRDRALIEHIKQSVKQHFGVKE